MVSKRKTTLPLSAIEHDEIGITEAARVMGCSRSYANRYVNKQVKEGNLEAYKVYKTWVIKASSLMNLMKK